MRVTDTFEIKDLYQTGHAPGLVIVLDSLVCADAACLVGRLAVIRTPTGEVLRLRIEEAKEHGPTNSLFFRNVSKDVIPIGCEITIGSDSEAERAPSPLAS